MKKIDGEESKIYELDNVMNCLVNVKNK